MTRGSPQACAESGCRPGDLRYDEAQARGVLHEVAGNDASAGVAPGAE